VTFRFHLSPRHHRLDETIRHDWNAELVSRHLCGRLCAQMLIRNNLSAVPVTDSRRMDPLSDKSTWYRSTRSSKFFGPSITAS
jgi:hypothetical protein